MAATSNGTTAPKPVRCAIYTRKSTEEGLNQEFNSLDAQREAAEAYILSQKHDGWALVPIQYSDGGYTGANIERPGVKELLADIEAGKIDCVVVYKVDRLSRSLIDFSKMMELFEKRGVCFVSITQQFNTKSSLGRLAGRRSITRSGTAKRCKGSSPTCARPSTACSPACGLTITSDRARRYASNRRLHCGCTPVSR